MNELLRQLNICSHLAQRSASTVGELAEAFDVSEPTIKRDIAALRHLGADIISDRFHGYRLMNWAQIAKNVRKWRELEQKREQQIDRGLI